MVATVNARQILITKKITGTDPLVDQILSGDTNKTRLYQAAQIINKSRLKRGYVEACLLVSEEFDHISEMLELPSDVLSMYEKVFFNVHGLDKLSKLELVDAVTQVEERNMKIWAMSQGLDFVSWRLGRPVAINPVEGLKDMFTLCVYKSKEALFSGNATESSKEATKWTKLSMDLARLLKVWVMDTDAAKKDIEMALKTLSPEFGGFDSLDADPLDTSNPLAEERIADTSKLLDDIGSYDDLDGEDK